MIFCVILKFLLLTMFCVSFESLSFLINAAYIMQTMSTIVFDLRKQYYINTVGSFDKSALFVDITNALKQSMFYCAKFIREQLKKIRGQS